MPEDEAQSESVTQAVLKMPQATVLGFWKGFTFPFRGLRFVFLKHFSLIRFWLPPILLSFGLFVITLWMAFSWHHDLTEWFWASPEGEGFWTGAASVLHTVVDWLVFGVLALAGFVLVLFFSSIVAAPFNDLLSEEVEFLLLGKKGPPFTWSGLLHDLGRTVALEAGKVGLYFLVMGPAWIASLLIPVAGPVLYAIFGAFFTASFFALDYLDWPAARQQRSAGWRFRQIKQHFWPMFGFGCGVWLFLFLPLVNLLLMPAAVVGGTLLFFELHPAEPELSGS